MQEKRENRLLFPRNYTIIVSSLPLWWNWQTRWTQNPVVVIPYRFDPDQRHQKKTWHSMCQVFFCVSGGGVENFFDPARAFGGARCGKGQHTFSEGDARELCERSAAQSAKSFFACRVAGLKISSTPREPSAEHDAQKGQCPFSEGDAREPRERSAAQSAKSFFACRVTGLKIPSTPREPSVERGAGKDSTPFPKATPASYASDRRHSTLCAKSFFACRVAGLKISSTPREPSSAAGLSKSIPFSFR